MYVHNMHIIDLKIITMNIARQHNLQMNVCVCKILQFIFDTHKYFINILL